MAATTNVSPVLARIARIVGSIAASSWVVVMLVGAGPGSDTMAKVYPKLEPLLHLLNVDNEWGFFAPNPDVGTVVRYRVVDGAGVEHEFALHEDLDRVDPMFLRYTTLFMAIVESAESYEPGAARFLCRRHADLEPQSIAIVVAEQAVVAPEDYRDGVRILDGVDIEVREARRCPDGEVDS